VVSLEGPLGAGKTTLVKGLAKALDVREAVTSPSFTIMSVYRGRVPLYHIDLYRIETKQEIEDLGLEDYLYGDGISVVEWGERAKFLFPDNHIVVSLFIENNGSRRIELGGIDP
jgi:tRNA threonylcarbamoyladenosine biosynthesis protein TsaE